MDTYSSFRKHRCKFGKWMRVWHFAETSCFQSQGCVKSARLWGAFQNATREPMWIDIYPLPMLHIERYMKIGKSSIANQIHDNN